MRLNEILTRSRAPRRNILLGCLLTAVLSGCGGDDKFERTGVSGTVNLDGKPLPFGTILFEGKPDSKNESAKFTSKIVDGKFSSPSGYGPSPGENTIRITVFNEAPPASDDDETETTIKGLLESTVEVEADKPLALDISSEDLERAG